MFVTTPDMEQWVPPGLGPPDSRYWRTVLLGTELPWFLLMFKEHDDAHSVVQTVAVAWESTLRQLVETAESGSVVGVVCFARAMSSDGEWMAKRVSELWVPSNEEASETGPLLFALHGESELYDSHQTKVGERANRRLLLRLNS